MGRAATHIGSSVRISHGLRWLAVSGSYNMVGQSTGKETSETEAGGEGRRVVVVVGGDDSRLSF